MARTINRTSNSTELLLKILVAHATSMGACCGAAAADSVTVHGVAFPVDEMREVDAQLVEVHLAGTARLVPRTRIEKFVVESYFRQPGEVEKVLSLKEHAHFVTSALDDGSLEDASLGLDAFIRRSDVTLEGVRDLVEKLQRSPLAAQLLKRVLASLKSQNDRYKYLTPLLVEVGLADSQWLRSNLSGVVFADIADFKSQLSKRFFRLLSERDNEGAQAALELYRVLTGGEDDTYRRMLSVHQKVSFLLSDPKGQNISEALSLIEILRQDHELEILLRSLVVNLIHDKLQTLLEGGHARDVLLLLSSINPTWRTPTTHEILLKALGALHPEAESPLSEPHVARAILAFSTGDERIRASAAEAYQRQISHLLSVNSIASAQNVLSHLILVNPDPSAINDEERLDIVAALAKAGREERAAQLLREVTPSSLGIISKVRYLWWNLSLEISFVTLLLLGLLFCIGLAFLRVRAKKDGKVKKNVQKKVPPKVRYLLKEHQDPSEEAEELPKFVRPPPRLPPEYLEYCEHLESLGLGAGATVKEIKLAYRMLMKEVHPDARVEDEKLASDRFMKIQQAYERAVELEERHHFSEQKTRE